jgi:acetyl-CoA carboxylase biotin carboxyl carrier protein
MSGPAFDPAAVRALAAILTESGLTEIEIVEKDSRIRVARAHAPAAIHGNPIQHSAASHPAPLAHAAAPVAIEAASEDAEHPGAVLSPMVGVAYLSPDPAAPPFVGIGQTVTAGQTLLLIEAMKTFNQIKAPRAGTVGRILIASGAPVEYGEVLMILEP